MKQEFSEFTYREYIQTSGDDALECNHILLDVARLVTFGDKSKLYIIPLAATLSSQSSFTATIINPKAQVEDVRQMGALMPECIIKKEVSRPSITPYSRIQRYARLLYTLPNDLPGAGFEVPAKDIAYNASYFLEAMEHSNVPCPEQGDVMPSPFGTIVIDIKTSRGLISMEIGHTKVGFFTDFEDGINEESDGISTDFHTVPRQLLNLLLEEE